MVACHRKLRALFLDDEVVELGLLWELVAEPDAIVVDAETDHDGAYVWDQGQSGGRAVACVAFFLDDLLQCDGELVVVVTDVFGLAPHGLPGLIEGGGLFVLDMEGIHQVGLVHSS